VLEVSEIQVRDVMVPRRDGRDPARRSARADPAGRDRIGSLAVSVVGEDRDEVVGILLAKDLLRFFAQSGVRVRHSRMRAARGLHPEARLNVLLRNSA
jgi:magnesium and cobalt transporter